MQNLEQEAKKFMEGKETILSKKLDELVENTKLLKNLSEVILKKAKELNAKITPTHDLSWYLKWSGSF